MQSNDFFASCATGGGYLGCYDRFLRIIKGGMTIPSTSTNRSREHIFNNRSTMNTNFLLLALWVRG